MSIRTSTAQGKRAVPRRARRGPRRARETTLGQLLDAIGISVEKAARQMAAAGSEISSHYLTRIASGSVEPSPRMARAIVAWVATLKLPAGVAPVTFADLIDTGEG